MIRKDNGAGPILGTSMLTLRLALRHQNLAKGSVLLVCCRGLSPTVREGSVAIRAGALPHGRASASLVSWQHSLRTLPAFTGGCHAAKVTSQCVLARSQGSLREV